MRSSSLVFLFFVQNVFAGVDIPDFFKNLVPVKHEDGLALERVDQRSCDGKCEDTREILFVDFDGEVPKQRNEKVSVIKGIRALYKYPNTESFANIKFEESKSDKFENDKKLIVESIKNTVKRKKWQLETTFKKDPSKKELVKSKLAKGKDFITLEEGTINGFEYIGYTENVLGLMESTLSQVEIFVPQKKVIVSAYLLNQKNPKFKNIDEFIEFRENFIKNYTNYLKAQLK